MDAVQRAELLYRTDLLLGEGAIWFPEQRKFLYVDILGKKLGAIDPVKKTVSEKQLDRMIGTVVPAENGQVVIALQGSIEEMNWETGIRTKLTDLEPEQIENRCNDGKCDSSGRFWVGTMHQDARAGRGALYSYQSELQKKIDGVSISNGICWSKQNDVLYYIDSADYNIKAFDFEPASGHIANERIIAEIREPGFMPDGMTIDDCGHLWVAIWGGGCVHRYDPRTGLLSGKVTVDAPQVTSCAFGGDHYDQLLITTARTGLSERQLDQYPLSGSLFMARTGVCGLPVHHFRSGNLKNTNDAG